MADTQVPGRRATCPRCGLEPIADGYSVCEVCAFAPGRRGEECPHLADVLAGRSRGPHDDSTCGWCARRRLGCTCGIPGTGNFDGPHRDCPIHGERSAERYCVCPDCTRCGCGMWERHHANLSEITPAVPPPASERSDEGPKTVGEAVGDAIRKALPSPRSVAGLPADGEERK